MGKRGVFVVNKNKMAESNQLMDVDLEEALDIAGLGKYQYLHCLLMVTSLGSAVLEMIGVAFILPAAACDLDVPDSLKGIITGVPNIGVVLTAPLWGRAADHFGRKPVLMASCTAAGLIGLCASLMPGLLSYALCKFVGSLFLACPSSLGFAFAGELVPRKRRDIALLISNGFLMLSTTLSPLLAWGVLPTVWQFNLFSLTFKPWRLLTIVYAIPLLLTAVLLTFIKESPKFLLAKGRIQEALDVLKYIFAKNTGLSPDCYGVLSLRSYKEESSINSELPSNASETELTSSKSGSAMMLLKPPHVKWLALTGFLMFGVFSLLNGLFLFAPDVINKVMSGNSDEVGTVCVIMNQATNATNTCIDTVSTEMFPIMVVTTLVSALLVLAVSICPVSKKTLLIAMFGCVGSACLLAGTVTNKMVAGAAMSALQMTALGIGPLTAYAVHLFPTSVRGTAVGAVLMFGRLGSLVGANAAGYFLFVACSATFYGFTAMLFVCAALSFLLPNKDSSSDDTGSSGSG